jgi:hypothetical protein
MPGELAGDGEKSHGDFHVTTSSSTGADNNSATSGIRP